MNEPRDRHFELDHPADIFAILERLQRERTLTTVEFGDHAIVSCVLAVDRGTRTLVFDVAQDGAANAALFASRRLAFVTELDRIPIAFDTAIPARVTFAGGPAAAVATPAAIMRLQRREWFRAALPVEPPICCTLLDERGNASLAQAVDLSGGGAGVIVDETGSMRTGSGHELIVSLPEIGPLAIDASLRTVRPAAAAAPKLRLGLRFERIPPRTVGQILRYVQRLEVNQLRVLRRRDR